MDRVYAIEQVPSLQPRTFVPTAADRTIHPLA